MHPAVATAQAVTDALNGGEFSRTFTAQRVALPEFDLAEMDALHVTVAPRGAATTVLDRSRNDHAIRVDVAVQQRVASTGNADVDPLLALVQEIKEFLDRRTLGAAFWVKTESDPLYVPDHLREMRQFTSVLTITYQVIR